jgi:hypothetical protein
MLVALLACRSAPLPRGDGCIVSAQQASDFYRRHSRSEETYFTPSRADVDALQATLEEFLTARRGTTHIVQNLAHYSGVFVGVIVDGRRRVRGSYSCEGGGGSCGKGSLGEWRDGGDCFFHVDFDPESRSYSHFYMNGVGLSEPLDASTVAAAAN